MTGLVPYVKRPEGLISYCLSLPCEDTARRQPSARPGSGPSPEPDHVSTLLSDFPASRTK